MIRNTGRDGGEQRTKIRSRTDADSKAAKRLPTVAESYGNQAVQRLSCVLQAKLAVSQPEDLYEQEADRVADAVMRAPMSGFGWDCRDESSQPKVRDGCGGVLQDQMVESGSQMEPSIAALDLGKTKQGSLQRSNSEAEVPQVDAELEKSVGSLSGRGSPLTDSVRSFMEPRFNRSFKAVRVHTDTHAQALAGAVSAQAFTVGRDIVFGAGFYSPETEAGRRLLAHELTHVVQQRGVAGTGAISSSHVEATSSSATSTLQRAPDVVFGQDTISVPENRRAQLARQGGWRQTSVIMTVKDFRGQPMRGHRLLAEFKAPGAAAVSQASNIEGGAVIWPSIWLKPEGTMHVTAISLDLDRPALAPEQVTDYKLPDGGGNLKFDVVQTAAEVTVTAETSQEAVEKSGIKGSIGVDFDIVQLGGEASAEWEKKKGTSQSISWKILKPTATFEIRKN